MSDRLDAGELLGIARQTVLEKLLPALPEGLRYEALMVANALAIGRREQQLGQDCQDDEHAVLTELTGLDGDLAATRRALAESIRTGRYDTDDDARTRLLDTLERITRRRLAIANPKRLARDARP